MGQIRRLPSDLANQIAAGEVVERPASVVKELVENAVDAGASRIQVDIERAGFDLIRVSDDGVGMDPEDTLLALERHATSKIRHKDDLFSLSTFGFRGEALPSIASVARVRLRSRARGAAEATEVTIEGGQPPSVKPAGAAEGTTVEVRELFFNMPARRKFLKSVGTEAAHVGEAVLVAALARPELSLFLNRDGRAVREWLRVKTRGERATQAMAGEDLLACQAERGGLRIEGFLSAPERARAGAVALHLLVNGRPVRDRPLARAVAQAYGSVLDPGRYPVGVVYVDVPPATVDVNVHPQKAEVRFAEARATYDGVTRELHACLARAFALPALGRGRGFASWNARSATDGHAAADAPGLLRAPGMPSPYPVDTTRRGGAFAGATETSDVGELRETSSRDSTLSSGPTHGNDAPWPLAMVDALAAERPLDLHHGATSGGAGSPRLLFPAQGFYAGLEYLAQLRSTFLLCAGADGLYVLDQHAAAERATFHRLRKAFSARTVPMQRLLVAEVVELSPSEIVLLEEQASNVLTLGVELRAVGPTAIAVHAVPGMLARVRPERIVRDLAAELGRSARRPFAEAVDLVLATMACHGSVRAGDVLAHEQAVALLAALDDIDFAGHCPHGRPIVTRIGYDELERRVGR